VVATKFHIVFYSYTLQIQNKQLHNQANINDLSCSPDAKLISMVGDDLVLIWDSRSFKSIPFPESVTNVISSKFSPDNNFFGVATRNTISLFAVRPVGDSVEFVNQAGKKAESSSADVAGLGTFTSFDFNPKDSSSIVVGFSSGSPRIYQFNGNSTQFIKISSQDQPSYQNNPKTVRFMPDGQRIFSSDNLVGVGLWPGNTNSSLVYNEGFLFFGPVPFDSGQRVLGYNWQKISIVEIQFECPGNPKIWATSCTCGSGQFWSLNAGKC
jgi:WD40 repeat protein